MLKYITPILLAGLGIVGTYISDGRLVVDALMLTVLGLDLFRLRQGAFDVINHQKGTTPLRVFLHVEKSEFRSEKSIIIILLIATFAFISKDLIEILLVTLTAGVIEIFSTALREWCLRSKKVVPYIRIIMTLLWVSALWPIIYPILGLTNGTPLEWLSHVFQGYYLLPIGVLFYVIFNAAVQTHTQRNPDLIKPLQNWPF